MLDRRCFFLVIGILFSSITNASAILTTQLAVVSAEYGSSYPTPYDYMDNSDTLVSDILTNGFGDEVYASTPSPNYGWVNWKTSEYALSFVAGQDITLGDYPSQGVGYSQLDLLWTFSVAGDGGQMYQDLLSGSGFIHSTLLDITTNSILNDLSVDCLGGGNASSKYEYDGGTVGLLDGHSYLLRASLENYSPYDSWEAEYYITLGNATISVPEPGMPLILSIGLVSLFLVRRHMKRV
jgi:hypothetical protein